MGLKPTEEDVCLLKDLYLAGLVLETSLLALPTNILCRVGVYIIKSKLHIA